MVVFGKHRFLNFRPFKAEWPALWKAESAWLGGGLRGEWDPSTKGAHIWPCEMEIPAKCPSPSKQSIPTPPREHHECPSAHSTNHLLPEG